MQEKRKVLIFDDILKTRSGKRIPFWYEQNAEDENKITDQSLHWFHEGYGAFQLYRLHEVYGDNDPRYIYFICEPLKKIVWNTSEKCKEYFKNPELALQ